MVAKFQILGVKITRKYICELKSSICLFLLMSPSKTLPQILIITTPGRRKLPVSPKQCFFKIYFSPAERGKDYEAEKMNKIKLRECWSQVLINSTIFAICTCLVSVLLHVPKFKLKHAEV